MDDSMPASSPQQLLLEMFKHSARELADKSEQEIEAELSWLKSQIAQIEPIAVNKLPRDAAEYHARMTSSGAIIDPSDISQSNPAIKNVLRERAMKLSNVESDKPLKAAFEKAGLDEKIHFTGVF